MPNIWLPVESDFALALRESNLLVPGNKPIGQVVPSPGVRIIAAPEFAASYGNNVIPTYGAGVTKEPFPDSRFGYAFTTDASQNNSTDYVDIGKPGYLSAFTAIVAIWPVALSTRMGLMGNWTGTTSDILFRYDVLPQLYIKNSSGTQYGPAQSLDLTNNALNIVVGRYDGSNLSAFTNGVVGTPVSASGVLSNPATMYLGASQASSTTQRGLTGAIPWAVLVDYAMSDAEIEEISRTYDFGRFLRPANDTPYLFPVAAAGGGASYEETLDGALTSGGDLAPVASFAMAIDGALSSGGDLADEFTAGAVTYEEALDGAMQSGGDLAPVVSFLQSLDGALSSAGDLLPVAAYGLDLDGDLQSGGDLSDTFTGAGLWEEALSGSLSSGGDLGIVYASNPAMDGGLSTGGDLVPVLSSTIASIGSLSSGGDLVVFVAYQQAFDGALQSAGDLADAFTGGTGNYEEALSGALTAGGDLVPVVQWGVLIDGALTVGGDLADVASVTDCTDVPTYTAFDAAKDALHAAVLAQFGESVTFPGIGLTVTAVFKRYRDTVPAAGARPGVPRDVLRVLQTDICAHDVDQGTTVTLRGQSYKVISVERTKHGMTHLGIRRTH